MAIETLSWGIWPTRIEADAVSTSFILDASAEKAATIWRAGHSGAIRKIHFRTATVTTGDTMRVSLQDVDTSTGDPDGVADQSGTVVVAASDDSTWKTVTLGADRTVTRGDWLAAVIEFDSFVAGNMQIARNTGPVSLHGAYNDHFTAAWAKVSAHPVLAVEYSDALFYPQPGVHSGVVSSTSFNVDTVSFDEYGMLFTLPFSASCCGLGFFSSLAADLDLVLYSGTTPLQSVSWDSSIAIAAIQAREMFFPASQTLSANTPYRVTIKPTTTSNVAIRHLDLFSAAARGQLPGGTVVQLTKRVDSGAWTDVDTSRPLMWLLLDGIDAGGGVIGPGGAIGGFQRA